MFKFTNQTAGVTLYGKTGTNGKIDPHAYNGGFKGNTLYQSYNEETGELSDPVESFNAFDGWTTHPNWDGDIWTAVEIAAPEGYYSEATE